MLPSLGLQNVHSCIMCIPLALENPLKKLVRVHNAHHKQKFFGCFFFHVLSDNQLTSKVILYLIYNTVNLFIIVCIKFWGNDGIKMCRLYLKFVALELYFMV